MASFQNLEDLRDFIESHLGRKARVLTVVRNQGEIEFSLYETFVFKASIDPRTKAFGFGLELPGNRVTKVLLGERFSLNNDQASVAASLDHADRYCRLAMPDKLLESYDALWPRARA
jgi:hypothetical protein